MKTFKIFALLMVAFLLSDVYYCSARNEQTLVQGTDRDAVIIVAQPELDGLAAKWASGFEKCSTSKLTVVPRVPGEQKLIGNTFYLVDENSPLIQNTSTWRMVAGHNVIVAIMNSENPEVDHIYKSGINAEGLSSVLKGQTAWNQLVNGVTDNSIRCYISEAQDVLKKMSEFTGVKNQDIGKGTLIPAKDVLEKVQKEVNTIGFCKLSDVVKEGKNEFASGITLVPVDKNRNGILDQFENIYHDPAAFSRGVWIGKYPHELSGDIFLVATEKPAGKANLDFLSYVLSTGQNLFKEAGFVVLSGREKTVARSAFSTLPETQAAKEANPGISKGLILAGILTLVVIAFIVYRVVKPGNNSEISGEDLEITPVLSEKTIRSPRGLYYGKSHTWAFLEPDGMINVGVDDFMKHIAGSITQIKLREPGEKMRKGEKLFTLVHEGKQLCIYSPVTGFIREQNQILLKTPSKLHTIPFTEGWLYKIEPANWLRDSGFMLMFEKYREWLDDEFIRLKDFLAKTANNNQLVFQHIVLQDGGELKDEVLADLSPEIWEEFQARFIDVSK